MSRTSASADSGHKVIGEAAIRDKHGNLLVAFSSEDAESHWANEYQRLRIDYCMKHRRDDIPMYLRTGERPWWLRLLGYRFGALRLQRITLKEARNG
jgi:hypothetical protein